MKSIRSQHTNDDVLSQHEDSQTFTQLALYKGALVAVRMINKLQINMNRDDLIEIRAVSNKQKHTTIIMTLDSYIQHVSCKI